MKVFFQKVHYFWTASIQRQLMLGIILIHAILMTIFVFDLVDRQHDFLTQQNIENATSLAETLSTNSTSWVLANDVVGLEEILQSQRSYPGLRYAMLLSPNGRVLSHTDRDQIGGYVTDETSLKIIKLEAKTFTLVNDQHSVDVVAPVISNGKLIAWSRVGLDQDHITAGLQVITRNGIIYTLIAIFVGTVFAFFMAKGLTYGLHQLVAVSNRVRMGEKEIRSDVDRKDELGKLSTDFNKMLDTLVDNEEQLRLTQSQLAESEERYNLAMYGSKDGIWDWNIQTNEIYYSTRWKAMLGYTDAEFEDNLEEWKTRVHPEDIDNVERLIQAHLDNQTPYYEAVLRIRHKDGDYRWHFDRGIAVRDANNHPYRLVGTTTDITERKQAEDALFEEKERLQVTLHSIGDAVITTDSQGRITFMNPIAESLSGWSTQEATNRPLDEIFIIINEHTREPVESPVAKCLRQGEIIDLANHTVLIHRNGHEIAIEDSAAPIRDSHSNIIGVIMVFHDVSLTREMAKQMTWQATHDPLTGLYNRREFERRLNKIISSSKLDVREHAVLYLDLDQFKLVNDTCGHSVGDILLKQLTFLLQSRIGEEDILARLGGDEFGLLIQNCNLDKAKLIAEIILQTVRDFRFNWTDKSFDIGVSIGLVQIDSNSENITQVLSAADMACYAAKDSGRNRIHVYQPDDTELKQRKGEMQWASKLTEALKQDNFELYCQGIYPLSTMDTRSHFEILLRLHDEGKLIPPGAFIPAAERYSLMPLIDRWVVKNSFRMIAEHIAKGMDTNFIMSINLSGASFSDDEFLTDIIRQIKDSKIPPHTLCFEVTETAAIHNLTQASRFIQKLKQVGCAFSLDDFGSGLSSFSYLKNLPVDYLKIDGSFVRDIVDDPIDRAMVQAINDIGHITGKQTIAEFVENDAIKNLLIELNVNYAQGYGLEIPLPLIDKLRSLQQTDTI